MFNICESDLVYYVIYSVPLTAYKILHSVRVLTIACKQLSSLRSCGCF